MKHLFRLIAKHRIKLFVCKFATKTSLVSALISLVISLYFVDIRIMFCFFNDHLNKSRFRIQAHIWY